MSTLTALDVDRLSSLRLMGILDKLPQGLCIFDGEQRLVLFNRRYADVYGITPDQLQVGMLLRDVLDLRLEIGSAPVSTREQYLSWREDISQITDATKTIVNLRDGRVIEIYHEAMPDGGWVSTHDDITERLKSEQTLLEKTALLNATLDTMDQGLLMVDGNGKIAVANRRVSEILGVDPSFLAAKPHYTELRRIQAEAGEYASGSPAFKAWVTGSSLEAPASVYERVRPNGLVLEVRNVDLQNGGALRTYTDITNRKEAEKSFHEQKVLLDATLENMDQGLMMVDAKGIVRICNERAMKLLDLPRDVMRNYPTLAEVVQYQFAKNDFTMSADELRQWVESGGLEPHAHVYERKRNNGIVLEVRIAPLPDGSTVRTYTDITERKRAEIALADSRERLALALESGSDGLWDWDVVTGEIWFSERWWEMLGYEPGEIEPRISEWFRLVHPGDEERAQSVLKDHCAGRTASYECEYRLRRKSGGWCWVLARGKVVTRDPRGKPLRIVGTHIDVSARKEAERRLAHSARHDALTDLPNRLLFREQLDQRLAAVRRKGGSTAVLCLDLDRFKIVNDSLGHLAGDRLLCEVAKRLRKQLRRNDVVARLGGDEFAIMLGRCLDSDEVEKLAGRLIAAVQQPINLGDQPVAVGLSIGIALAPEHGNDSESIFRRADLALYRAKSAGRNTSRLFDSAMDDAAAERRTLEVDLRRAVSAGELVLHYQPQVRTETGELTGFEALVRWNHPRRGMISPSIFIPLAEDSGLIVAIGEWVLRTACREAARWRHDLKVAINLSPCQFAHINLPDVICKILREENLLPERLELEITETVIINDMSRTLTLLHRLRDFGIKIAMDDFGTGYSSLATLQAFPFDRIKIDRSFVGRVGENEQAAAIVRAVLGLGRSLRMGVIAEGVETAEQIKFLAGESCEEVQGFLYGKPAPIETFGTAILATAPGAVQPESFGSPAASKPEQSYRAA